MINPVNPVNPVVDSEGYVEPALKAFLLQVAQQSLAIGTGTPEGHLESVKGRFYMDEAGAAGSVIYVKQKEDILGDRKKGWILV